MPYAWPASLLAGFHADCPAPDVPELVHVGEQWVPRVFTIATHAHPVWEFYVQISGKTSWSSPQGRHDLASGHFLAVPPGTVHTLLSPTPSKHHFYFVALDLDAVFSRMPLLAVHWHRTEIVHVVRGEALIGPFQHMIREVVTGLPYRTLGLRLALDLLVVEATRLLEDTGGTTVYLPAHPAVYQARTLMEDQPDRPWRLQDLAATAGVSGNYLLELFKQHIGMPPHQFLIQERIKRARAMLTDSDAPITAISLELGFASSQHFASTFKRLTGKSARAYRAASRQRGTGTASKSS
jgi:AraC-like DNA-binding protein